MPISLLMTALLIISILTNLTVEAFKKVFEGSSVKYSTNMIAAIFSIILSAGVSVIYILWTATPFTGAIGIQIAVLMYLSFLVSTLGYDKVIQMLRQIGLAKEVPHE